MISTGEVRVRPGEFDHNSRLFNPGCVTMASQYRLVLATIQSKSVLSASGA
ncbi:MAG TPA: hypothetical protein VMH05_22625 [Bryobacteraceae bacterium]|nr:hypothetical protein [Bryobacteraceae bacterium]